MITVNPKDATPLYAQIVQQVKYAIASGVWKAGDQLPSVREFSSTLTVNPNTVLKALGELERAGVVETRRGQGCFVAQAASAHSEEDRMKLFQERVRPLVGEGVQLGLGLSNIKEAIEQEFLQIVRQQGAEGAQGGKR